MSADTAAVTARKSCDSSTGMSSYKKVFEKFDTDGSGSMDIDEVKHAIKILLGWTVSPALLDKTMQKFDKDGGGMDVEEFGCLVNDLIESRKEYKEPVLSPHEGSVLGQDKKLPFQDTVFAIYNNKFVAKFVALCIVGNFFINILEKQIDPDTKNLKYSGVWSGADVTFNIIFLVELWANMWSYGGPTKKFRASGWNIFDTIIVAVGVLTMVNVLGPPLDKLKLARAFRVFRLFKRIESLDRIIVALLNSIPGVLNAFVVMIVFFCIYAILAVELFREFGEGGTYETFDVTLDKNATNDAISARGFPHGIEYYGTFMRALFTLFQVMTGESWAEAIARPLLFGFDPGSALVVGIFFVSFIILAQMVLINVVVAVLLEKFVANDPEEEGDNADAALDARLASLDSKKATNDMNAKLDNIFEHVVNLSAAVGDMQARMAVLETNSPGHFVYAAKQETIELKKSDDYMSI